MRVEPLGLVKAQLLRGERGETGIADEIDRGNAHLHGIRLIEVIEAETIDNG